MRYLRHLVIAFALVLAACASAPTTPAAQIEAAAKTVEAYVDMTLVSLQRGRITPAQAEQASANAKKARDTILSARAVLSGCPAGAACPGAASLLKSLQPSLYEFERQLREQQGAK